MCIQIAPAICGHIPWHKSLGILGCFLTYWDIGPWERSGLTGSCYGNLFQERLFGIAGSCISGGLVISVNSFGARGALFIHMVATFVAECYFEGFKSYECEFWSTTRRPYGCHKLYDSTWTAVSFWRKGLWANALTGTRL